MTRVAVLGAGSWGTTLANLLAAKGESVRLWAYEPEVCFVHQCRWLKRLSRLFLGDAGGGEFPQFIVNEWQKLPGGVAIPRSGGIEQSSGVGHYGRFYKSLTGIPHKTGNHPSPLLEKGSTPLQIFGVCKKYKGLAWGAVISVE